MGCKGGRTDKAKTRGWKKLVRGTVRRVSTIIECLSVRRKRKAANKVRDKEGGGEEFDTGD